MEHLVLEVNRAETRSDVNWIQWELFVHHEIRRVMPADRAGAVLVLYEGDTPDIDAWRQTLEAASYRVGAARQLAGA